MHKIAIIGDVHLRERSPGCRKDDYLSNVLDKLEFVLKNNDSVVCLGDVFHSYSNSDYLFYRVYSLLSRYPNKFITILGNHDIVGRNHNELSKTTLGSLEAVGALQIKKDVFEIDGTTFAVSLVDKSNFDSIPIDKENENILLAHNYFDFNLCEEESLSKADIRKLNYQHVFLGHDHAPHDEMYIGNSTVVRMGAFTRSDAQNYNEDREIFYYEYDTETKSIEQRKVPSLPKEEVFVENAFEKKSLRSTVNFLKISEVLKRFNKSKEGNLSLLKTLEKANCPQRYISMIKTYHEMNGVDFF